MAIETEGIILKAKEFKESDLMITLFSRKLGKISVIAKGAKRVKSTFLPGTQPFSYGKYYLQKTGNFYSLRSCELIKSYFELSKDIVSLAYASYIAELTEHVLVVNEGNNRLFQLLGISLELFLKYPDKIEYITTIFQLKLMIYLGYKPEVLKCVICGNIELEKGRFSYIEGGMICTGCQANHKGLKIDPSTVSLMEYIMKNPVQDVARAKVSPILVKELSKILKYYMGNHLDSMNLKSLKFLESL